MRRAGTPARAGRSRPEWRLVRTFSSSPAPRRSQVRRPSSSPRCVRSRPTRAQPGCIWFGLYQLQGASGTLVGIEQWASAADEYRPLAGAHFQRLAGRMADLIAEPPGILTYTVIDE